MAEQQQTDQPEIDPLDALDPESKVNEAPEAPKSEYAGKTPEELESIIIEQKNMIGRQSNEVGEVREKIARLEGQLAGQVKPEVEAKPVEVDYFGDPANAITTSIENSPQLKATQTELADLKAQFRLQNLYSQHNDAESVLKNQQFREWVSKDPIKTAAYSGAIQVLDASVLGQLITDFKSASANPEVEALKNQDPKQTVRKAATGNVSSTGIAPPQKKMSRADIQDLINRDPVKYRRMKDSGKLREAYLSGRITK